MALGLIRELLAVLSGSKELILSMHDELSYAGQSIKNGAGGYVMRVNAAESFIWAVQTVIDADIPELKNRELGVLKLIAQGLGTNKLSERLRHGPKPFRCIESISGRD